MSTFLRQIQTKDFIRNPSFRSLLSTNKMRHFWGTFCLLLENCHSLGNFKIRALTRKTGEKETLVTTHKSREIFKAEQFIVICILECRFSLCLEPCLIFLLPKSSIITPYAFCGSSALKKNPKMVSPHAHTFP